MQTVKSIINGKGEQEYVPVSNRERYDLLDGLARMNATGDFSSTTAGYRYDIDTLTFIHRRIVDQKFYTVTPSDYFSVLVGSSGAWSDTIVRNRQFSTGSDFEAGVVAVGTGETRLASVSAGLSPKSFAVNHWAKQIGYNIAEVQQALYSNVWDPIAAQVKALKTNYDLGFQEIAFLGSSVDNAKTPGFLTNPDINTNTSLITEPISGMTSAEFQTFVGAIVNAYSVNTDYSENRPDTFVMPMSDFQGLTRATDPNFTIKTKYQYLLESFQQVTQNPNFQILPLAYAEASKNAKVGLNKQAYMLYRRNDEDVCNIEVPLMFQLGAPATANNFTFNAVAQSRYSGFQVFRELEMLKFTY